MAVVRAASRIQRGRTPRSGVRRCMRASWQLSMSAPFNAARPLSFPSPPPRNSQTYTRQVLRNSPYQRRSADDAGIPESSVLSSPSGRPSPIEHVIYIVKENRTYDQVLGDMGTGNGDASLCLFPRGHQPEPSQAGARVRAARQLLRERRRQRRRPQLVDRRHRAGLRAEDVAQQLRRAPEALRLRGRRARRAASRRLHLDQRPGARPHLAATTAGGLPTRRRPTSGPQIAAVRDPLLAPHTNLDFRGFDLDYPDIDRAKVFLKDLAEFEKIGQDAAPDHPAARQRPHLRHRARQELAPGRDGRQRSRAWA